MAASKRFRWGFAILGVVAVVLAMWAIFGHKKPARNQKAQAVPVSTAQVVIQDMPVSISALGAAQAWRGVTVRTQVNGKLLSVAFREGSEVRARAPCCRPPGSNSPATNA